MKLDQALENIRRVTNKLPKEEFACIRDNKEKAIPALLECVKKVAADEWQMFVPLGLVLTFFSND